MEGVLLWCCFASSDPSTCERKKAKRRDIDLGAQDIPQPSRKHANSCMRQSRNNTVQHQQQEASTFIFFLKNHQSSLIRLNSASQTSTLPWNHARVHTHIHTHTPSLIRHLHSSPYTNQKVMKWQHGVWMVGKALTPSPGPSHTEFRATRWKEDLHIRTQTRSSRSRSAQRNSSSLPCFPSPLVYRTLLFHTSLSLTQLLPASHMPCPCALRQTPVFKQVWTGSKGSPNSPYSRWRARTVCHSALYVCHRRSVERMRIRDEYHPSSLLPSKLPSSPIPCVSSEWHQERNVCVLRKSN